MFREPILMNFLFSFILHMLKLLLIRGFASRYFDILCLKTHAGLPKHVTSLNKKLLEKIGLLKFISFHFLNYIYYKSSSIHNRNKNS